LLWYRRRRRRRALVVVMLDGRLYARVEAVGRRRVVIAK